MATNNRYGGGMRRTSGIEEFAETRETIRPDGTVIRETGVRRVEGDTFHFVASDAEEFRIGAQGMAHMLPDQFERVPAVGRAAPTPQPIASVARPVLPRPVPTVRPAPVRLTPSPVLRLAPPSKKGG